MVTGSSKTAEISRFEKGHEGETKYRITTPDHEEEIYVRSIDTPEDYSVLIEADGYNTIDIPSDQHFHVEVDGGHADITVFDEPQVREHEFVVPYRCGYNFNELVSEFGVPDTEEAAGELKYMPTARLDVVYDPENGTEVVGVEVDGEVFTPE